MSELPKEAQLVLAGMIVLLAISHELHRSRVNSAINEASAKNCKGIEATPLPKKFTLKLTAEM